MRLSIILSIVVKLALADNDFDHVQVRTAENCFLIYCNANTDLKNSFCGGGTCSTDAHFTACKNHWDIQGIRENSRLNKPEPASECANPAVTSSPRVISLYSDNPYSVIAPDTQRKTKTRCIKLAPQSNAHVTVDMKVSKKVRTVGIIFYENAG